MTQHTFQAATENSIVALKEKKGKKVIKAIQKLQVEALLRAQ